MKVHIIASLAHHQDHCWAIWKHLPAELQGMIWLERRVPTYKDIPATDVIMVGGFYDIDRARGRPTIYVEHGAGQSYDGDKRTQNHPAYHGGSHPVNVLWYVSPRQSVADSWDRPAVAVGSPVCDLYVESVPRNLAVFGFHWDCHLVPETRQAYSHYADHLGRMVRHVEEAGFRVAATSHPRDNRLPFVWRNLGVERITAAEVREEAALFIADNTSLMFEMAHLGRSVIALNAPWYRRDVDHGLRFWEATCGIEVDDPTQFLDLDIESYVGSPTAQITAEWGSLCAYDSPRADGHAGERAAQWIIGLLEEYGRGT